MIPFPWIDSEPSVAQRKSNVKPPLATMRLHHALDTRLHPVMRHDFIVCLTISHSDCVPWPIGRRTADFNFCLDTDCQRNQNTVKPNEARST